VSAPPRLPAASPLPGDLGDKLGQASDARLLEVVALIDSLPLRGPADRVIAPLRPRLAALRPPRPVTIRRVLVLPLEDLIAPAEECWPGRRRVSRAALGPIAEIVMAGLEPGLERELRALGQGRDTRSPEAVLAVGGRLWPEAARLLGAALPEAATRPDHRPFLPQLQGAAALIGLAPALVPALLALPPKPMVSLPPAAAAALLPALAAARAQGPEALLWALELVLARSLAADIALGLVGAPELGLPAREREACANQLARGRVADMRHAAERLERSVDRPTFEVVDDLVRLVADLDALDERSWPGGGTIDKALLKSVRETTADVLFRRLDRAVGDDLLARFDALPTAAGGGTAEDDREAERLEEVARSVRRLGLAGAQLGLAGASRDMFLPYLDAYRARFLDRAADGPARLEQLRLVEILFGPDAAMGLLREARGAGEGAPCRTGGSGQGRARPGGRPARPLREALPC
jgi:hypothetical protein